MPTHIRTLTNTVLWEKFILSPNSASLLLSLWLKRGLS